MEELTYDEIVAKLRRGEELDEYEIRTIVWESHQVYEMEGEEHRWHREMFTVIDLDGELWGHRLDEGADRARRERVP